MLFEVDPEDSVPIYAQIMQRLKWGIASGVLVDGAQLPSVRELATRLRVNPNTVIKAYRELEYEGFIKRRHGQGTFVSASGEAVQSEREDAVRQAMGRAADVALAVGLSECEATGLLVTAMRDRADAAPSREGDVRDE